MIRKGAENSGKLSAVVSNISYSSAVSLNNLGVRYHAEGKFRESNEAHKECSAILEAGGPETDSTTRKESRESSRAL